MMRNAPQDLQAGLPQRGGVQAIARAAEVLRALEESPEGVRFGELATSVDLPKSTVHRILGALADEDLVQLGPDGSARLGGGLARLGATVRLGLRQRLAPVLLRLRRELDETVDLSVLDGDEVRFVEQFPAPHRLRAVSAIGATFPLHCTANGKALLAGMTDAEVMALLPARLQRFTGRTITTRTALLAELEKVRAGGLAFDLEEHAEGICAVGAVVLDPAGPVAAISVPAPTSRFDDNRDRLAEQDGAAAREGTRLLGG